MSYAAAARKAAENSGGTPGVVGAGVSKPKTSPNPSGTKKSSPPSKKTTSSSKRPGTKPKAPVTEGSTSATRHSLRLEGKPPEISPLPAKVKYENNNFQIVTGWDTTREGACIQKRLRRDKQTGHRKLVAYCADRGPEHFYPGMIIRATKANSQTSLRLTVDELDDKVRKDLDIMVHRDGPVFSKKRPMVVLFKTVMGLVCVPMGSRSTVDIIEDSTRTNELVSATKVGDESWPGKTPWAGKPLIFEAYEVPGGQPLHEKCFINIATPLFIANTEEIHIKIGRLNGDQYCRLLNAFMFRQRKLLEAAFGEYGEEHGLEKLLEVWQSQKSSNMLWPAEISEEWRQMEVRMSGKSPQIIGETGEYTLV